MHGGPRQHAIQLATAFAAGNHLHHHGRKVAGAIQGGEQAAAFLEFVRAGGHRLTDTDITGHLSGNTHGVHQGHPAFGQDT